MVDVSNVYCYHHAHDNTDDEDSEDDEISPTRFPTVPCTLVAVNQREFHEALHEAVQRLHSNGLVIEIDVSREDGVQEGCVAGSNELSSLIEKIKKTMKLCDHALFRSQVYAKPDGATFTFVRMMDVSSYLHKLLTNECLRDGVIKHFHMIEKLLSHPACEITGQLKFDLDLIEVCNGFCFSIRNRRFMPCPIEETICGKVSPRSFVDYDCSKPPDPGHFRAGILNSFQDPVVRVNILNKFYQCLMASKMPQKVRKLVVVGPRDSGKTSWANVFHRVVPAEAIASITSERQFSAAMLTDHTQLVIIDEWSANTDLAKTILQGGWMITAVKHGQPKRVMNNSPYYITTNTLPDFDDEDENVHRRIQVFNTISLSETDTAVHRWIFDHAMDCIAWIANEIEEHSEDVANDELWYEPGVSATLTVEANEGESLFQPQFLRDIRPADLTNAATYEADSDAGIHVRFLQEYEAQRLPRRRRAPGETISSDDDDDLLHSLQTTPPSRELHTCKKWWQRRHNIAFHVQRTINFF